MRLREVKQLMKQTALLPALAAAFILGACGDGTSLPTATGKADIRAINAIKTAPEVGFLIEERVLGSIDFRQISSLNEYDDLDYNFNFDVFFLGDATATRIATQHIDIVADMDYILLLSGTLSNATITVWETAKRTFDGTETVFEARFAHISDSLGSIDYYFAAPGVAPVLGEEAGTLSFGDVLTSIDYTAGDFVLTVTTSGDPSDVLYQSDTSTFLAATQYLITTFDGGANTNAPIIGRVFSLGAGSVTGSATLADINYPATVEFVNGSLAMGTVDICEDVLLTSLIVDDHPYMGMSAELNLAVGDNPVYYTPFDGMSPVLIETTINFFTGIRGRVVSYGPIDALSVRIYFPDRRPLESQAKLQFYDAAINYEFVNIYLVEPDEILEDQFPIVTVATGTSSPTIPLLAGSYDLYMRDFGGTVNIAGPIRLDVVLDDVVSAMIFDTIDPSVLELQFLPTNP